MKRLIILFCICTMALGAYCASQTENEEVVTERTDSVTKAVTDSISLVDKYLAIIDTLAKERGEMP